MATREAFRAAVDDTREYAAALGSRGWLTLAAIILLVTLGPSIASRAARVAALAGVSSEPASLTSGPALLAIAVVAGVFVFVRYLAAVADLVIVESLCTNRLPVRQYTRHNLRRGLELLGFRLALVVAAAALIATPLIVSGTTSPAALESLTPTVWLAVGIAAVVAGSGYLVVGTLTTAFVVPIMQRMDYGPLAGWRRFWTASTGSRLAVAAYLLLAWVIGGIAAVFKYVVSFFLSIIGFTAAVFALAAVEGSPILSGAVGSVFLLGYLLFLYLLAIVLNAPVTSYLRYAALELLGTTDPELAFLADGGDSAVDDGDDSAANDGDAAAADDGDNSTADDSDDSAVDDATDPRLSGSDAVDPTDTEGDDGRGDEHRPDR